MKTALVTLTLVYQAPFRRGLPIGPLLLLAAAVVLATAVIGAALILRSPNSSADNASIITAAPRPMYTPDPTAAVGFGRSAGFELRKIYTTLPEMQAQCRDSAARPYGSADTEAGRAFYDACVGAFTS